MSQSYKESDVRRVFGASEADVDLLAAKAKAFDKIVSDLGEAGFETCNMTYQDITSLVCSLSTEGIEAAARQALQHMIALYSDVVEEHALIKRVTSEFVSEANKDVSAVMVFMNGFKELTKKVEALTKEAESTKELLAPVASGAIQDVQRIGRQIDNHGKVNPVYHLPVDTADFVNGLKMLMGASVIPDKGQKHVR